MRLVVSLTIIVVSVLLAPSHTELEPRAYFPHLYKSARVTNGDFESGLGGDCDGDGPYNGCYQEQLVASGWTFTWEDQKGAPLCLSGKTGRPEVNLSDRRHPNDVWSGEFSAHAFTYWRCGRFAWYQVVDTEIGKEYTLFAMARTWPGNDRMHARLCLDDYCTPWRSTNGAWVELSQTAVAGDSAVVSLEAWAWWPDGINNDIWFDGVGIEYGLERQSPI